MELDLEETQQEEDLVLEGTPLVVAQALEETALPVVEEDSEEAVLLQAEDSEEAVLPVVEEDSVEAVLLQAEDSEETVLLRAEDLEEAVLPQVEEDSEEAVPPVLEEGSEEAVRLAVDQDLEVEASAEQNPAREEVEALEVVAQASAEEDLVVLAVVKVGLLESSFMRLSIACGCFDYVFVR